MTCSIKRYRALPVYVGDQSLDDYQTHQLGPSVDRALRRDVGARVLEARPTFYSEGAIEFVEVNWRSGVALHGQSIPIQQLVEIADHAPNVKYLEITGGMDKLPLAVAAAVKRLGVDILML